MKDGANPDKTDSSRWMIGEDSAGFGGAIRDMWSPTCIGAPGKVSDAEYVCDAEDNGGVHTNSGVVNHSYALLVDGGTYNDVTVEGIGLDKAANIYFRAQNNYLTFNSQFPDLADALEQSCQDLVGQPINELSTDPDDVTAASRPDHDRRLRAGHQRRPGGAAAHGPHRAVWLRPAPAAGEPGHLRRRLHADDGLLGGLRGRPGRLDRHRGRRR